jgi:hypothetical protein
MSNDLEEKFVSDDGVSSVPSPATPAGGEIKKRRADVKKAVNPKAETVSEDEEFDGEEIVEEEVEESEEVSIDESIAAMFEGMDLSEDFKTKAALVFEAAVNAAASEKVSQIAESLEEEFEANLTESVNEAMEEIIENLDSYLDYVVSEWMEENTVAIESGIKVEMAESLMDGLRELFSEHNIEIDEDTVDVVADLEEELEALASKTNEVINENLELHKVVMQLAAESVFNEVSEGLTVSQKERLRTLSEKLDVSDIEEYESDLHTIKESFFKKKAVIAEEVDEETEILTEETAKKTSSPYASVNAIVDALNSRQFK